LDSALDTLNRALNLAAPEGYVRSFVDYGLPMGQLLPQAAARGVAFDYASKLLAAFPTDTQESWGAAGTGEQRSISRSQAPSRPDSPVAETLNDRELSILRLMAAGLSNREIAGELYLSVNTIKAYSSQLYGKMGVKKRAEAVARAYGLDILK
jgi:LuxR family maltose regulon positive regulatory protein